MPCALTSNLTLACPLPFSGVTKFCLIEFPNVEALTTSSTGVTGGTLAATKVFRTWTTEPEMISATSSRNSHRENGVADSFTQKVAIKIPGVLQTVSNEIDGQNSRFIIAIKYTDGSYRLYGKDRGLVIKKDEESTGVKQGDFQGYDLEFEGVELSRPIFVTTDGKTALGLT